MKRRTQQDLSTHKVANGRRGRKTSSKSVPAKRAHCSAAVSVRSLARKHQELWQRLNRGLSTPLFNLDAFAALTVAAARASVTWDGDVVFEARDGATVPVRRDTGISRSADAEQCTPGVYLSGAPHRAPFLHARNQLLDGGQCLDAAVVGSIVLATFTSSDCDCPVTALSIAHGMKLSGARHAPFLLQDVRPFNPQLCRASFDPALGSRGGGGGGSGGGYRIPCSATRLRSGRLCVSYRDVSVQEIGAHIGEQHWEQEVACADSSLRAALAHAHQWRLQMKWLGLEDACHVGLGSRQRRSAITSGFYHMDWLFCDPDTGMPRTAAQVESLADRFRSAGFEERQAIFSEATRTGSSQAAALDASGRGAPRRAHSTEQNDVASLDSLLWYIRRPENAEHPLVLFSGSGLASIAYLAEQMLEPERRRVTRIGMMLLTTEPSRSILTTSFGQGISYNEAVDPASVKRCFFTDCVGVGGGDAACREDVRQWKSPAGRCAKRVGKHSSSGGQAVCGDSSSGREHGDNVTLRRWFPCAAIYIWNTMSSKGVLEQDL